jgi:hypothetical protein
MIGAIESPTASSFAGADTTTNFSCEISLVILVLLLLLVVVMAIVVVVVAVVVLVMMLAAMLHLLLLLLLLTVTVGVAVVDLRSIDIRQVVKVAFVSPSESEDVELAIGRSGMFRAVRPCRDLSKGSSLLPTATACSTPPGAS